MRLTKHGTPVKSSSIKFNFNSRTSLTGGAVAGAVRTEGHQGHVSLWPISSYSRVIIVAAAINHHSHTPSRLQADDPRSSVSPSRICPLAPHCNRCLNAAGSWPFQKSLASCCLALRLCPAVSGHAGKGRQGGLCRLLHQAGRPSRISNLSSPTR